MPFCKVFVLECQRSRREKREKTDERQERGKGREKRALSNAHKTNLSTIIRFRKKFHKV